MKRGRLAETPPHPSVNQSAISDEGNYFARRQYYQLGRSCWSMMFRLKLVRYYGKWSNSSCLTEKQLTMLRQELGIFGGQLLLVSDELFTLDTTTGAETGVVDRTTTVIRICAPYLMISPKVLCHRCQGYYGLLATSCRGMLQHPQVLLLYGKR